MLFSPCVTYWEFVTFVNIFIREYIISSICPEIRIPKRFLEGTTVLWKSCIICNVFINLIKRLHREVSNQLLMDKKLLISHHFCNLDSHTLSPLSRISKSCCSCSSCQGAAKWAQVTISYCLVGWKPDQCDNGYPMQRSTISALLSVQKYRGSISLRFFLVFRKLFWRVKPEFLVAL